MWELTADNALEYLRQAGRLGEGPARVEPLGGGVSNAVWRVEQGHRRFVLKQSRPQLRTREAWFSDVERIYREEEVMRLLGPLLPEGTIPKVLFSDRPRFLFAMEHAPEGARPWKELLLSGQVDLGVAERAGRILGLIHEETARRPELLKPLADRGVFVQLRVEPFYRRIQERHPDLAGAIEPLIDDLMHKSEALCHGDYSPKNLLVAGESITLVDHETAHRGEPAMDVGFFFSHLLLKTVRAYPDRQRSVSMVRAAWRGYASAVQYRPADELLARGVGHLGVCLLSRIDGTSPVDYLPEESRRGVVRRLGRALVLERPSCWGEVLGRLGEELIAAE